MSEDSGEHSVTQHLGGLLEGNPVAVQEIFDRYFGQVLSLARNKLRDCPKRYLDEHDVAQNAFANFFDNIQEGRFAKFENRDDLWQILAMIVNRKAIDQFRKVTSEKNGYGIVSGDSINKRSDQQPVIDAAMKIEPGPDMVLEFTEEFEKWLKALKDEKLRRVAILKLAGYKNREIAQEMDTALRNVERWIGNIKVIWKKENDSRLSDSSSSQ